MAIEDAYELANNICSSLEEVKGDPAAIDMPGMLRYYQSQRLVRAADIHGMAGMAAFMASTYKVCLVCVRVCMYRVVIAWPGHVTSWGSLSLAVTKTNTSLSMTAHAAKNAAAWPRTFRVSVHV